MPRAIRRERPRLCFSMHNQEGADELGVVIRRESARSQEGAQPYHPTRAVFCEQAQEALRGAGGGALVPVCREILADLETPVSAFLKLTARDGNYAFLLESVAGGENVARYSYMGVQPAATLFSKGTTVTTTVAVSSPPSPSLIV
ncbi:MAG: hypothetical protein ACE5JM_10700 [Armatimonadota bacterium]